MSAQLLSLPPAFQVSQSSLQDYAICARRFQLRYLMEQEWPTPAAEPLGDAEQADMLGKRFHRLVERYWLDLPIERDKIDATLRPWWDAFLQHPIPDLPAGIRRAEVRTSAVVHGQRMVATFDLLAYNATGDVMIVDWKTTKRRSSRAWLDRRLQTVIYPLLLIESAPRLIGRVLKPEQVRLVYWFANAPTEIEVFQYSTMRYEQDQQTLAYLIDQLLSTQAAVWPLTNDVKQCRLCQYRSLCNRGSEAGSYDDIDTIDELGDIEDMSNGTGSFLEQPDDFVL
ncbi:MAG: PD-(D/E)XK nuclease family protein [Chloroflexota bacterium]